MQELPVRELLPGDICVLRLGDVAPADCLLLGLSPGNINVDQHSGGDKASGDGNGEPTADADASDAYLLIDESQLTGETLPVRRSAGAVVPAGASIKRGQMYACVSATGAHLFLGRTAQLLRGVVNEGYIQRQMKIIGYALLTATVVIAVLLFVLRTAAQDAAILRSLQYSIVLTVVAIPLSMPIVLAVCTAVGAQRLAAHGVIVKQLHAMEDMASMSILACDKTGTLTLNELTLEQTLLPGDTLSAQTAEPSESRPIRNSTTRQEARARGATAGPAAAPADGRDRHRPDWHRLSYGL